MRSSFFLVCCYAATFSELMGPVVRDTTDQMRIAFSHQLLVLLLDIGDGHQHVTQKQHEIKSIRPSFYVGALSPCWKYYHSNNWKGNCRKSWTDLQVFFFFFLFKKKKIFNFLSFSRRRRHICSVNLFIHKVKREMKCRAFDLLLLESYIYYMMIEACTNIYEKLIYSSSSAFVVVDVIKWK